MASTFFRRIANLLPLLACAFSGFSADGADAASPFRSAVTIRGDRLEISMEVAPDTYLYEEATRIAVFDREGRKVPLTESPVATPKLDSFLNETVNVFGPGRHIWAAAIDPEGSYRVTLDYQGCRAAVDGQSALCYMPESRTFQVGGGRAESEPAAQPDTESAAPSFTILRQQEGLLTVDAFLTFLTGEAPESPPLTGRGIWWIVLFALLAGLALNLTPCVLPLIPVNLAIIGADGGNVRSGLLRASFYGLGMALAYGTVGTLAVLTGTRFGTLNSSPWFNLAISLIFLLLALAMFGVFNLDFSRFSLKLDPTRKPWGKLLISFLLGAIAALLAGACVAPVLIAVIMLATDLYSSGNSAGILLPFLLGVGMALPWPLAGAGIGILPKPGAWMNKIKYVFGTIILLAALYYGYQAWNLRPGNFEAAAEQARFEAALAEGRRTGKTIFVDFWASWCKNCLEMERTVFADPRVKAELENFVVVKIQAEKLGDPTIRALLAPFRFSGLPAFAVIQADSPGL